MQAANTRHVTWLGEKSFLRKSAVKIATFIYRGCEDGEAQGRKTHLIRPQRRLWSSRKKGTQRKFDQHLRRNTDNADHIGGLCQQEGPYGRSSIWISRVRSMFWLVAIGSPIHAGLIDLYFFIHILKFPEILGEKLCSTLGSASSHLWRSNWRGVPSA